MRYRSWSRSPDGGSPGQFPSTPPPPEFQVDLDVAGTPPPSTSAGRRWWPWSSARTTPPARMPSALAKELIARGMQGHRRLHDRAGVRAQEPRSGQGPHGQGGDRRGGGDEGGRPSGPSSPRARPRITPPPPTITFWGYYDSSWSCIVYEPQHLSMDRVVTVETARLRPPQGQAPSGPGMSDEHQPQDGDARSSKDLPSRRRRDTKHDLVKQRTGPWAAPRSERTKEHRMPERDFWERARPAVSLSVRAGPRGPRGRACPGAAAPAVPAEGDPARRRPARGHGEGRGRDEDAAHHRQVRDRRLRGGEGDQDGRQSSSPSPGTCRSSGRCPRSGDGPLLDARQARGLEAASTIPPPTSRP